MTLEIKNLETLTLNELRSEWANLWKTTPHKHIGRKMLINSIIAKYRDNEMPILSHQEQKLLQRKITAFKRNPRQFDNNLPKLAVGTRLVKDWKGQTHIVTITKEGYEYNRKSYTSLSKIATEIAGSRWNGWVFFGLKK
jgi:hypothetical protein